MHMHALGSGLFHEPVCGGAKEDRTPDLLRAKQALSQLSYGPRLCLSAATQQAALAQSGGSGWT